MAAHNDLIYGDAAPGEYVVTTSRETITVRIYREGAPVAGWVRHDGSSVAGSELVNTRLRHLSFVRGQSGSAILERGKLADGRSFGTVLSIEGRSIEATVPVMVAIVIDEDDLEEYKRFGEALAERRAYAAAHRAGYRYARQMIDGDQREDLELWVLEQEAAGMRGMATFSGRAGGFFTGVTDVLRGAEPPYGL